MLDQIGFRQAASGWDLPPPGSNRGYPPVQLIEQWIVAIWCGAGRLAHAETVRFDGTLIRLFDWPKAAGYQAIMRLFKRFDMARNESVQESVYHWFFSQVSTLRRITLDMDSMVLTRHGEQEGATRGYSHPRLQAAIVREARWWALETGLELAEITYQAQGWSAPRRIVVVRQSAKRKTAPGKTLSLFADDPDLSGWRYGAMVTSLTLPDVEVWRSYRGRADCENRIKELKADFGLDSFALNNFWATEAALGFAMLAYKLISLFRQAVMRTKVQHTLATLHSQVLAIGASWHRDADHNTLILSPPRKRRAWFMGLWSNSGHPLIIPVAS